MKHLILFFLLFPSIALAQNESYYQEKFCKSLNGQIEYQLKDRTRIDCLTVDYAIEVDFAKKWAEAIGQSLYYASQTNKNPGIVLIIDPSKDQRYLNRISEVILFYDLPIKIWTIKKEN